MKKLKRKPIYVSSKTGYTVKRLDRADVKDFIETHHYSRNINGVTAKFCFGLYDTKGIMVGACLYGALGMANAWKKYGSEAERVIELRRLVLIDKAPKNTESWFIGQTLKWLKTNSEVDVVVSYADTNYGHVGTIYKATNFIDAGQTGKTKVILFQGRKYHDKAIRAKYKGELKPYAVRLREALENGEARYVEQLPKIIYVKYLRKRRGRPRPLTKQPN